MPGFFLFRNHVLVDKYCDPNGLGAGHLYDIGQEGDVLVHDGTVRLSAYKWSNKKGAPQAWIPIMLTDEERQFWKALILLFI